MSTSRARLPRTPLTLAVLNLLSERAMHPYEMKTLMRERGHDGVIKLKGGSVYDTVERLQRLGFIDTVETSREGRRPERTVYAINEAGRDELKAWLRDMIARPVNDYPQFAAALAFVVALEDREEVISELSRRAMALEAQIAADETILRSMAKSAIPRIFGIELEYAQAMRRAEMGWVRRFIEELKEGDLWPDVEALRALAEAQEARAEEVSS